MRFQGAEAMPCNKEHEETLACRHEMVWSLPSQEGNGEIRRIELAPGFVLFLSDYRVCRPFTVNIDYPYPGLGFGFLLSGSTQGRASGMQDYVRTIGGQSKILYYRDQSGVITDAPKSHRQSAVILLEPEAFLSMFHDGDDDATTDLCRVAESPAKNAFSHSLGLTNEMYVALSQVFNAPLSGPTRKLYLESKALELIALRVKALSDRQAAPTGRYRFSSADMTRIHDAAEMLTMNMLTPPTLSDLSKTVGLSHVKLNRGFRRAFDTTVFGYLRRIRLQRAKRFLETSQMNVTEASFAVGYNSLSSFSKAFQGQYGITPHACLKSK